MNDSECLQMMSNDTSQMDVLLCDGKIAQEYSLFQFNDLATTIVGYAQLALNNPDYESLKRAGSVSLDLGQKIADLARSLMIINQGTLGEMAPHNIDDLLRQVLKALEPHIAQGRIRIETEFGVTPKVQVDAGAVREVLMSLLNQGIAGEGESIVRIRTEKTESCVRLQLQYVNRHISREALDRCCVPLFNKSTVRGGSGGAGGKIAASTTGNVAVAAEVQHADNGDTSLVIALPYAVDMPPRPPARVLVVDDEPVIQTIFSRVISRGGHEVTTVASGVEAIQRLQAEKYDIVLLDWMMPGMNGLEVLEKAHKDYPDLPIVIVTAAYSRKLAAQAIEAGAMDCIGKPLNHKKVLFLIEHYAGRERTIQNMEDAGTEGQGEVLLVVEPDALMRDLYHMMFDRAKYECSAVEGYEQAAAAAEKEYHDAILINEVALHADGSNRLQNLRRLNPYTPVLVISNSSDDVQQQRAMRGATAFLEKPVQMRLFLQRVRQILDVYKEPSAGKFKV